MKPEKINKLNNNVKPHFQMHFLFVISGEFAMGGKGNYCRDFEINFR